MFQVRPLKGDIIEASACPRLLGIMKRIQGTYIITSRTPCPTQTPPKKATIIITRRYGSCKLVHFSLHLACYDNVLANKAKTTKSSASRTSS